MLQFFQTMKSSWTVVCLCTLLINMRKVKSVGWYWLFDGGLFNVGFHRVYQEQSNVIMISKSDPHQNMKGPFYRDWECASFYISVVKCGDYSSSGFTPNLALKLLSSLHEWVLCIKVRSIHLSNFSKTDIWSSKKHFIEWYTHK